MHCHLCKCILSVALLLLLLFGMATNFCLGAGSDRPRFIETNRDVPSSKANEFVLGFMSNGGAAASPRPNIVLFISTNEVVPVSFTVEVPGISLSTSGTTAAGSAALVRLPTDAEEDGDVRVNTVDLDDKFINRNKGVHVKAEGDKKISVYGLNDDDVSTDAFLALPCVYYPEQNPSTFKYFIFSTDTEGTTGPKPSSKFLIVPCDNDTTVKIIPTQVVTIEGDINADSSTDRSIIPPGQGSIMVHRLQTILIESPNDLTGTILESDKPISVFTGHECGHVPENVTACDHLVEQIPPHIAYGKLHLTAPLSFRESGERFRIGSLRDGNAVNITCTTEGEPQRPIRLNHILNTGSYTEFTTIGDTSSGRNEDYKRDFCCIESQFPVAVMQYMQGHSVDEINEQGDPSIVVVPPVSQYLNDFGIATSQKVPQTEFDSFVSYVLPSQFFNPVDDADKFLINETAFRPESGYFPISCSDNSTCGYGAYTPLSNAELEHLVRYDEELAGMYLFVYGTAFEISFEYPAGFGLEPIGLPWIEIPDMTVMESVGEIEIKVRKTGGDIGIRSEIVVTSEDGTADAIGDYLPVASTNTFPGHRLIFQADEIVTRPEDTLRVMIIDDDIDEPTETFVIRCVEVISDAYVVKDIGTITILDDDGFIEERFRRLGPPEDGLCLREGEAVRYECTIRDTVETNALTYWEGSAFSLCRDRELALRHEEFVNSTSVATNCGNVTFVVETSRSPAEGLSAEDLLEYTSTLAVTPTLDLNGTDIRCSFLRELFIGRDTLVLGVLPFPPEDLSVTFVVSGVRFTLNWVAPDNVTGGIREYNITSITDEQMCGVNCGGTVNGSTMEMSCTGWQANDQICNYTVQTISDDCGFASSASEVSVLLSGHRVSNLSAQLVCSGSLSKPDVQVSWMYHAFPPPTPSFFIPQLETVTLVMMGPVEDNISIPLQPGLSYMYSRQNLTTTGEYSFSVSTQNQAKTTVSESVTLTIFPPSPSFPPEDLSITFVVSGVRFDLRWVAPDNVTGGIGEYNITSITGEQCGVNCGGTVDGSTMEMSCTGWQANEQICNYTVQTISDDCGFASSASEVSEVSVLLSGHRVSNLSAQLVCSDSLSIPDVQVSWMYRAFPPPTPSFFIPQLETVTLVMTGPVEDNISIPLQPGLSYMYSRQNFLTTTGEYSFSVSTQNEAKTTQSENVTLSFQEVTCTVDDTQSESCLNISFSSECIENAEDFKAVLSYTQGGCPVGGSPTTVMRNFSTTGDTYSTCVPLQVNGNKCYGVVILYLGRQVSAPCVNEELTPIGLDLLSCSNSGLRDGGAVPNVTTPTSPHGTLVTFSCSSSIRCLSCLTETRCNNGMYEPAITASSHNCSICVCFIVVIGVLVLSCCCCLLCGCLCYRRRREDSERTRSDKRQSQLMT